jgi:RNA polymerase sigma-70 factor, ECF subfamily
MTKRTEQLIILKLKSGDPEAYSDLYNEYSNALLEYIFYRVSDRELAKDILQEVYTRFIEVLDKEHITNIKAYLYKIAKNLVIDFYRSSGKQTTISLDQTAEVQSILGKESTEAKLDLEIVIKAVDRLKPMWREIIILRIIEGHEFDDIAEILGKSKSYIRVNLHRALKELTQLFEQN